MKTKTAAVETDAKTIRALSGARGACSELASAVIDAHDDRAPRLRVRSSLRAGEAQRAGRKGGE